MTARHIVLAAGAVLVLGLALYLFVEVRSRPAVAQASGSVNAPHTEHDISDNADKPALTPTRPTTTVGAMAQNPMGPRIVAPDDTRPRVDEPEATEPTAPLTIADPHTKGYRLDAMMAEANKAYDRGELDEAKALANKILTKVPNNSRMLRILVSAACIEGETAEAQKHYNLLPPGDRETMRARCAKYSVTLAEPAAK